MKHIQLFEQFINESANRELIQADTPDQILRLNAMHSGGPNYYFLDKKKGLVVSYSGSAGEETRILIKCTEADALNAIEAAKQKFYKSKWSDFKNSDLAIKAVESFLKNAV